MGYRYGEHERGVGVTGAGISGYGVLVMMMMIEQFSNFMFKLHTPIHTHAFLRFILYRKE